MLEYVSYICEPYVPENTQGVFAIISQLWPEFSVWMFLEVFLEICAVYRLMFIMALLESLWQN